MDSPANQVESARPRFLSNLATVLGGQAANMVVALLSEICVARLLGPASRGLFSVCTMAILFGALLGGLGGEVPIVIWAARRHRKQSDWLSTVFLWGLLGCAFTSLLWELIYSRLQVTALRGVTPSLSRLVLASIPLAILFNYLIALLTGGERFYARAKVGFIENAASLAGFLVLAAVYGRDTGAAVAGNWAGLAVGSLVAAYLLRNTLRSGNWAMPAGGKEIRAGLFMGLYGNLGNVSAFFNYRLDVFVVNYFLDPAQVGIYAVGVVVSESLWQIPQAAATALFPRTARTSNSEATAFTCLILRQVLLISLVSGAILAFACPAVIPLVFGSKYAPSVPVIWWILPGTVALGLGKVAASDLAGRYKTIYTSIFGVVTFLVTVSLDLLLIPRMGIEGAAIASSVAYMANGGLLLAALRHELKVKWADVLIPSRTEVVGYRHAWTNLMIRLRLSNAASS